MLQPQRRTRVGKIDRSPGYCQNYQTRSCHLTTFLADPWHPQDSVQNTSPAQKLLMASNRCEIISKLLRMSFKASCDHMPACLFSLVLLCYPGPPHGSTSRLRGSRESISVGAAGLRFWLKGPFPTPLLLNSDHARKGQLNATSFTKSLFHVFLQRTTS